MIACIVVSVFILIDVLTGILKSLYNGNLNSTNLRKGLYHKTSEIIAVAGSLLLEYGAQYIELNVDLPLLGIVSTYICLSELISILENLSAMNTSLAKLFKPYLEKLKGKEGENNDTEKRD